MADFVKNKDVQGEMWDADEHFHETMEAHRNSRREAEEYINIVHQEMGLIDKRKEEKTKIFMDRLVKAKFREEPMKVSKELDKLLLIATFENHEDQISGKDSGVIRPIKKLPKLSNINVINVDDDFEI